MSKANRLYTVRGSEDGVLCIATSADKALTAAAYYIRGADGPHSPIYQGTDSGWFVRAKQDLLRTWFVQIDDSMSSFIHVEIESFQPNHYHGISDSY